jgi:hypothetical protein
MTDTIETGNEGNGNGVMTEDLGTLGEGPDLIKAKATIKDDNDNPIGYKKVAIKMDLNQAIENSKPETKQDELRKRAVVLVQNTARYLMGNDRAEELKTLGSEWTLDHSISRSSKPPNIKDSAAQYRNLSQEDREAVLAQMMPHMNAAQIKKMAASGA